MKREGRGMCWECKGERNKLGNTQNKREEREEIGMRMVRGREIEEGESKRKGGDREERG